MNTTQKSFRQLFVPIYLELLFSIFAGTVDTLMLSTVGDQAVGGVGTANTYISVFVIMFMVISSGMTAVMTQYIGANQSGVAKQALRLGLAIGGVFGILLSAFLSLGAEWLLCTLGIAEQLLPHARVYMQIVGVFCVCNALIPIYSSYLCAFGHTAPTMAGAIAGNIVNLVLNSIFLFIFHWGVWGVALATSISKVVHLIWVMIASHRRIKLPKADHLPENRLILAQIFQVGLPAAMESFLYNVSVTLILCFLNQMDATGMQVTARAYAMQIAAFSYCGGTALSRTNAIMVGWRIGMREFEQCKRDTHKIARIGILVMAAVSVVLAAFSKQITGFFSPNPEMIQLVGILLWIDVILELGRACNLVYGTALKTSGDAVFPVVIGVIVMFICGVGGTWLFGIHLGCLAVGAYIAMALDECVRGILMLLRWHSDAWKKKGFLT
jgi:putative MATE family efflux protein